MFLLGSDKWMAPADCKSARVFKERLEIEDIASLQSIDAKYVVALLFANGSCYELWLDRWKVVALFFSVRATCFLLIHIQVTTERGDDVFFSLFNEISQWLLVDWAGYNFLHSFMWMCWSYRHTSVFVSIAFCLADPGCRLSWGKRGVELGPAPVWSPVQSW